MSMIQHQGSKLVCSIARPAIHQPNGCIFVRVWSYSHPSSCSFLISLSLPLSLSIPALSPALYLFLSLSLSLSVSLSLSLPSLSWASAEFFYEESQPSADLQTVWYDNLSHFQEFTIGSDSLHVRSKLAITRFSRLSDVIIYVTEVENLHAAKFWNQKWKYHRWILINFGSCFSTWLSLKSHRSPKNRNIEWSCKCTLSHKIWNII